MFANLKNKLIEEVKSSPSKFQQLANAAQAAVSSSSSTTPSSSDTTTTNEHFFSITEEDTPQNSPYKPLKLPPGAAMRGRPTTPQSLNNGSGAVPRTRKLSNSSMASDVSFRLPSYDSPAMYHLQSDLDISESEMEDSASTAKLDVITKEQLYDAYRKSLDRYHKYRCRYTDLAKKYKDLERDSTKARSVLVETQEKAIRRISELREQCTLEQQAKAHLEEALRVEMDDMQCKMQAYQTKLKLLGENPENIAAALTGNVNPLSEPLIDLGSSNASEEVINGSISNNTDTVAKFEELRQQLQERDQQLTEMGDKLEKSIKTIELLRKQEEENALLLAQTKQAIHSELENKESEVKKLTDTIKNMQNDLQEATKKETQLNAYEAELRDLKEKLKQMQTSKQEADAKIIATEHMLSQIKEQFATKEKVLASSEDKFASISKESEQKLLDLRQENSQLSEMIQRYQQNEISLAEIDNELNRTKNDNDNLRETVTDSERKLAELERELNANKETIESLKLERTAEEERLNAEKTKVEELLKQLEDERSMLDNQQQKVNVLESELRILNEQNANNESETISALKAELHKVNKDLSEQLNAMKERLANKEKEHKASVNKLTKQKKQHEVQQIKIAEHNEEIEKLKNELGQQEQHTLSVQHEAGQREEQTEREKNELRTQISNILHEISQMEEQMRIVQESHAELESEKRQLETKIENMHQQTNDANEDTQRWRELLNDSQDKLKQLELKLQNVESENSQLAEKNCLLEENSNRMEKQLADRVSQQSTDEAIASEMRLQLETAEDAIQKLNEKMSQVLDENSRMHNNQELMDHDCRSLQDKCDALEKEKLLALDAQKCLETELEQLKESKKSDENTLRELTEQMKQAVEKLGEEREKKENVLQQLMALENAKQQLEKESEALATQLNDIRAAQSDDEKLKGLLEERQKRIHDLEHELNERNQINEAKTKEYQKETAALKEQLNNLAVIGEELERSKEVTVVLREQLESVQQELSGKEESLEAQSKACLELEAKLQESKVLREATETVHQELTQVKDEADTLRSDLEEHKRLLNEKQEDIKRLQHQIEEASESNVQLLNVKEELKQLQSTEQGLLAELSESKKKYVQQISELEEKIVTANADIEKLHESNVTFELEIDQLQSKHQLQVEDLESSMKQLQDDYEKVQSKITQTSDNSEKLIKYEQMQVENEYLDKHAKQLEQELVAQKQVTDDKVKDSEDLKEKLKSIQCELYVLQENAEKHDQQLEDKEKEIIRTTEELGTFKDTLAGERTEWLQQSEHAKYITEQNDSIQQELLHSQQRLEEAELKLLTTSTELEQLKESAGHEAVAKEKKLASLGTEIERNHETIETLKKDLSDLTAELETKSRLHEELNAMRIELEERSNAVLAQTDAVSSSKSSTNDAELLRKINSELQSELEDLKYKSNAEISNLQQEIEDMQSTANHMTERMMELECMRAGIQAQQLLIGPGGSVGGAASKGEVNKVRPGVAVESRPSNDNLQSEKDELEAKLKAIMSEVQDVSNRNLFLEQKCENFLILEQSNERLKLQNSKLSRQLDETLVSMQHNEGITANTEFEYLKNIMFQYLTGSANGNNETLVKVISAVLKFSPQQTQVALEKEHQRRSLINKIL